MVDDNNIKPGDAPEIRSLVNDLKNATAQLRAEYGESIMSAQKLMSITKMISNLEDGKVKSMWTANDMIKSANKMLSDQTKILDENHDLVHGMSELETKERLEIMKRIGLYGKYAEIKKSILAGDVKGLVNQKATEQVIKSIFEETMVAESRIQGSFFENMKARWDKFNLEMRVFNASTFAKTTYILSGIGVGLEMLDKAITDLRSNLGIHTMQAAGRVVDAIKHGGIFAGEWLDATKALSSEFKGNLATADKLADLSSDIEIATGSSAEASAKFATAMYKLSGFTSAGALASTVYLKNFASIANVAPSEVMTSIAQNTNDMMIFSRGHGENVNKAAIAASKLGVEYSSMFKMARGLLDVDSSIESELEASVLLGKQINLQGARQAAFQGDLVGMVTQTVSAVGDLNNLSMYQADAIEKATGMSISDLKQVQAHKTEINSLDKESREAMFDMVKHGMSVADSMDKVQAATGGILKNLFSMNTVKFFMAIPGLVTMMKGIGSIFPKIGALGGKLGGWLGKSTVPSTGPVAGNVENNVAPSTGPVVGNVEKQAAGSGKLLGGAAGSMIKGAAALVLMAGAMWIFAKALQEFGTVKWESIAMAGVALAGLFGVAMLMGSTVEFMLLGAVGLTAMSLAFGIFGIALSAVVQSLPTLGEFFKSLTMDMATNVAAIGLAMLPFALGLGAVTLAGLGLYLAIPAITAFAGAIFVLGAGLNLVGEGLSSITSDLTSLASIAGVLTQIGEGFDSIGGGLFKMAGGLLITAPLVPVLGAITAITGGEKTETAPAKAEPSISIAKMDQILNALGIIISKGIDLKMNGQKIATTIGLSLPSSAVGSQT